MKKWTKEELDPHAKALLSEDEYDILYPQRGAPLPAMVFGWTETEWMRIKLLCRLTGCKCPHLVLAQSLQTMEVRRQLEGDNCEHPFQIEELAKATTPRVKHFLAYIKHSHEQDDKRKQCHQGADGFYCYCDEHNHSLY